MRGAAGQYFEAMTERTGFTAACHMPAPLTVLHPFTHKRVVGELLPYLRLGPCSDPAGRSRRPARRFGNNRDLEGMIITEILRVGQPAAAREPAYRGPQDSSASRLLTQAAVEALDGRMDLAEQHMLTAHRPYEREGAGAHPVWVRKAACALLRSAAAEKAVYLRVTAQVMSRAPLPPVEIMLNRLWRVSFEPEFAEEALAEDPPAV
ncbi:hypothetical protein [Streptomyces sp. NPDC086777]|uniref:hypothetical protein n=1 Tax=Streptomyces sp. NPDC086777 TaxID=3154866 RepID=UPI00344E8374